MPLRHIAVSSTLPPLRHGRHLMRTFCSERGSEGILPEIQVKNFGGDPLGVARNGSSERPLTHAQVQLFLSLTNSRQVNDKQHTVSPTTDARSNVSVFQTRYFPFLSPLFPLPYFFLSPLPLRSRTLSTNLVATTRQSYAPPLHLVCVSFPY